MLTPTRTIDNTRYILPACFTNTFRGQSPLPVVYLRWPAYPPGAFVRSEPLTANVYSRRTSRRHGVGRIIFLNARSYVNNSSLKSGARLPRECWYRQQQVARYAATPGAFWIRFLQCNRGPRCFMPHVVQSPLRNVPFAPDELCIDIAPLTAEERIYTLLGGHRYVQEAHIHAVPRDCCTNIAQYASMILKGSVSKGY